MQREIEVELLTHRGKVTGGMRQLKSAQFVPIRHNQLGVGATADRLPDWAYLIGYL